MVAWRVLAGITAAAGALESAQSQGKAVIVLQDLKGLTVDYFPGSYRPMEVLIGSEPHLYFPESELSSPAGGIGLPVETFVLGIPPTGSVAVSILESRSEKRQGVKVAPVASISVTEEAIPKVKRMFGKPRHDQGFPESAAELKEITWFRDQRIAVILVHPLRYDPSGQLTVATGLRIRIEFDEPSTSPMDAVDPYFESSYRSILLNYEQAKSWRRSARGSTPSIDRGSTDSTGSWFSPLAEYLRARIAEHGLYTIPFEAVQTLIPPSADPTKFDLFYKGKSLSFLIKGEGDGIFGPGDTIEFWGTGLFDSLNRRNEFSDTSVYWISVSGTGGKQPVIDSSTSGNPDTVISKILQTILIERDSFYYFGDFGLPANNQTDQVAGEGWYWRRLFANQSTDVDFFSRNFYQTGNPTNRLRGRLHSPVFPQSSPDHMIEVSLNGTILGQVQFSGYSDTTFAFDAPSSLFVSGLNRITLQSLPTGASLNEVLLDWLEVEALKDLTADSDTLYFPADEGNAGELARFDVLGFTSPDISAYRMDQFGGIEKKFRGILSGSSGNHSITFYDTVKPGTSYFVLTEAKKKRAESIERKSFTNLRAPTNGADYLVLAGRELAAEANRLAQYRGQQGMGRTKVVFVEDIYDEFNFGHFNPHAIRRFILVSDTLWVQPTAAYVVFFGDANWDYKDNLGTGKTNIVPSLGNPVSDALFVESPVNKFLPQKHTGRIPVRSLAQAQAFVNMLMNYESSPLSPWNKRYMFMASGFNATETARFQQFSDQLISLYVTPGPLAGFPHRLYKTIENVVEFDQTEEVKRMLEEGALWINFYGHAGTDLWGNGISNPVQLRNAEQKRHLVSDISCSTARFAEPLVESFGKRLLTADDGGAVGYIGSSGFGYETPLRFLADKMYQGFAQDSIREPGRLMLKAKVALWQTGTGSILTQQALQQLTLLGDPATQIAVARRPDFFVDAGTFSLVPALPSEADSEVTVNIPVMNLGLASSDSVNVQAVHTIENEFAEIIEIRMPAPGLADTIRLSNPSMKRGGIHHLVVEIDPLDIMPEHDESNNSAAMTFFVSSGQLQAIRPFASSSIHPDSVTLQIQNPNIRLTSAHRAMFEIDSSETYSSPAKLSASNIPLGIITTAWTIPPGLLADSTVYYWRARLYSGVDSTGWVAGYFLTRKQSPPRWIQDRRKLFEKNLLEEIAPGPSLRLLEQDIPVVVSSAGFDFGSQVTLLVNGQDIALGFANRGYNIGVINQYSGKVESFAAFDIHQDPDTAGLAQFLEAIPYGRKVLIAISDEGANNKTERINQLIESLGSALIRSVGFRASWAIIGWKGASIGSVPEGLMQSGEPVTLQDTLQVKSIAGKALTESIGPASQWKSIEWEVDTVAGVTHLDLALIRTMDGGSQDTVSRILPGITPVSSILPGSVKSIRLLATLQSDSVGMSPALMMWAVDHVPSAEIAINYQTVTAQKDSLLEGETGSVSAFVHNVGDAAAESVKVSFSILENNTFSEFSQVTIPRIDPNSFSAAVSGIFQTTGRPLRNTLLTFVDPGRTQRERFVSNNVVSFPLTVLKDSLAPTYDITFDSYRILDGDHVSPNPEILVSIRDNSPLPIINPNNIVLKLDNRRISLGGSPDSLFEPTGGAQKARVVFRPKLTKGDHILSVQVQDASGNFADTVAQELRFRVETSSKLLNVLNIPNPVSRETSFTFNLTGAQVPQELLLKVYTVGGRLVYERKISQAELRVGFNRIDWDARDRDGDLLANGVYFYKLSMKVDGTAAEVIEKLAIIR